MQKTLHNIVFLLLLLTFSILTQSRAEALKVGLVEGASQTYIASSTDAIITNAHTNKIICRLDGMKFYTLKAHPNTIGIVISGKEYDLGTNTLSVKSENGFLSTKKRWYRGDFLIKNQSNTITIINNVQLEDYLMGVVPSEMPSKWNEEALKAQAIAARSYAIANMGKHASKGYDLKDNTEDQVYGGATSETAKTNKVVMDTQGIVVTYDHKIIPAYYHASAGGVTNNSGGLWYKDLPYLKSVPAFDDGIKRMGHGVGMSQYGANNLASQGYNAYQILSYFYNNIKFGKLSLDWSL